MHIIFGGLDIDFKHIKFPKKFRLSNENHQIQSHQLRNMSNAYNKNKDSRYDDWDYFEKNTSFNDYEQLLTMHNYTIFKADQHHILYKDLYEAHNEIMIYLNNSEKHSPDFNEIIGYYEGIPITMRVFQDAYIYRAYLTY